MPALAAANVTITSQSRTIEGKRKRNVVKITFGDGALTYPSGGVPMPDKGYFGMSRFLESLHLIDADDGNGIHWKYDYENKKLRAYIQGVTTSAAGAATVDDFPLNTTADPLASAISISGFGLGASTSYLGKLKELTTTQAPAAQTIYAEAVGW